MYFIDTIFEVYLYVEYTCTSLSLCRPCQLSQKEIMCVAQIWNLRSIFEYVLLWHPFRNCIWRRNAYRLCCYVLHRILTSETFSDTSECFNFLKNFQEMDKDLGEKWKWVSQTLCYAKNWTLAVTISKIIVNLPVESGKSALSALIWILLHDDGATC